MGGCSAVRCSGHSKNRIRLFRFPADAERRRKWTINCGRDGWVPGPRAELCIAHFEESQFEQHRKDNWKKLKPNAIPTLFGLPNRPVPFENKRIKVEGIPNSPSLGSEHQVKQESRLHLKQNESTLNASSSLHKDLLSFQKVEKANMRISNASPVLSVGFLSGIEKLDHRRRSVIIVNQNSVGVQTEECPAEPLTNSHKENWKSNLDNSVLMSFQEFSKRVKNIEMPSERWGLSTHRTFIMCTKWDEAYMAERKVVIDEKLNVKVFLHDHEVRKPKLEKLQSAQNLINVLRKVDSYRILMEKEGSSLTNLTQSTISKMIS